MNESLSCVSLFEIPRTLQSTEFSRPEYWAVSFSLLQGITPTQGSNPGLPHCRQILYQLRHKGSLRILEWVAYSFSIGSSQPRNRTGVSCIAGGFFTNWAIREALLVIKELESLKNNHEVGIQQLSNITANTQHFIGADKLLSFGLKNVIPFIGCEKLDSLHMQTLITALNIVLSDGRWGKWFIVHIFLVWRARKV